MVGSAHGAAPRALAHYPLPALDAGSQTVAVTRAAAQRLEVLLMAPSHGPGAGVEDPGLGGDHRLVVALRVVVEAWDLAGQDVRMVRLSQLTV